MKHQHKVSSTPVCEHKEVEFCPLCDKVFCKNCGKEWDENQPIYQPIYQPMYPFPLTWPYSPDYPTVSTGSPIPPPTTFI